MREDFWDTRTGQVCNILGMLAIFMLAWEAAVHFLEVKQFLLPPPSKVFLAFVKEPGYYLLQMMHTLWETLLGFSMAVVIGILLAVGIVYSRFLERTLYMLLVGMNAVPKIALAPLFIVWLGMDLAPKVAIATLVALFPIVIDTVLGLRSVEPDMLDLAKAFRGSRNQVLFKIRFPNALPSIFAGLKVGISFAFIGAIVGEFVSAQQGLGYVIVSSQANFDTPRMFVAIMLLAVIGTALFYIVEIVEKRVIPWHVSHRTKASHAGH
ncbi:MAG: Hydroxymethylpyrimidine transporter, transrane component [Herminiimonas sp.]|jgi:NitT/TauT family transport system permease protein|nr:Hydroxymethylpyrimidine transporter, transrane component [Herminiimonas sp.]